MQSRPKRCIFFNVTKSKIRKICEFQVEISNLSVSLPLLWPRTSTQNIHKTTEGSHFSDEGAQCSIDNFSGRFFTDGFLGGGVDIDAGYSHLPTSDFRFSDQNKEICVSTMSNHTNFGNGDKLSRHDYNPSTGERGSDSKKMSRSSEEIISFNTGVDIIYWEADINSHCSSASTALIWSNAMPVNIGVVCSTKLQLRNKVVRQDEDRTAVSGTASSLKRWGISYILSSPVNNSLRCIFRMLGSILSKTQSRETLAIIGE